MKITNSRHKHKYIWINIHTKNTHTYLHIKNHKQKKEKTHFRCTQQFDLAKTNIIQTNEPFFCRLKIFSVPRSLKEILCLIYPLFPFECKCILKINKKLIKRWVNIVQHIHTIAKNNWTNERCDGWWIVLDVFFVRSK